MAYLSLGSNMGDRIAHLSAAEEKLNHYSQINIIRKSKIYETEPWPLHQVDDKRSYAYKEGGVMWYLNQVVEIETNLTPDQLLNVAESVELDIGRSKKHHWGSREIDIDILLYNNEIFESDHLTIPHRHMTDRQFVLVPLLELEPHLKDPVSKKSYRSFLGQIKDNHRVVPFL